MKTIKQYTFTIEYSNKTFPVEVTIKSGLRRINYKVEPGVLKISAPYGFSEDYLKKSINKLPLSFLNRLLVEKEMPLDYQKGYIYLLGQKHQIARANEEHDEHTITYVNERDLERKIKSYALAIFTKEIRKYEEMMNVTDPYNVRVGNAKTRHGSNSRQTHTICLNINLIHYNINVIDSVVVHELAHHFVFNHSNKFYNVVYQYCPQYDYYHKLLSKGDFSHD